MISLQQTDDGSFTAVNSLFAETYHSSRGAYQESLHVFIRNGLDYKLQSSSLFHVSILEIGFGTGLNFFLSADTTFNSGVSLKYHAFEPYLLSGDLITQLGYERYLVHQNIVSNFTKHYEESLLGKVQMSDKICLTIEERMVQNASLEQKFDIVYFDAFSSKTQPELWAFDVIEKVCKSLNQDGVFVTYAITGELKRHLKALGLEIHRLPGSLGKREMLRAIKR